MGVRGASFGWGLPRPPAGLLLVSWVAGGGYGGFGYTPGREGLCCLVFRVANVAGRTLILAHHNPEVGRAYTFV